VIITVYDSPTTVRSIDMDRTVLNLRNMFPSIHRIGNTSISGTIIEDVTTFTSQGDHAPEQLVDALIEKYGEGDVYDVCNPGEQARRISAIRVDEADRGRQAIPKNIYSGSEMIYVIKPDRDRITNEIDAKCRNIFKG